MEYFVLRTYFNRSTAKVIKVEPSDTIEKVKIKIENKCGIPPDRQCLNFRNKELETGSKFYDLNIPEGSTLLLKICDEPSDSNSSSVSFSKIEFDFVVSRD